MNVCFIISGFAYSGAEVVLERYLYENKDINPNFIILYSNKLVEEKFKKKYGENNVICLKNEFNKNILRLNPLYYRKKISEKIKNVIKKLDIDAIYMNNTMESFLCERYVSTAEIPAIAHIHDMKSSIKNPVLRKLISKSLESYDEVITVSEATKADWGNERMTVIYNGLDKNYFFTQEKLYGDIKKIGFVGTICKRKGVDLIINEIDKLVLKGYEMHIAYGGIEDNGLYQNILDKKERYENKIYLYNNLNYDGIRKFYDSIDLLIVPSIHDPLPTVIMESSARKTLVLGRDIDGIPEMISDSLMLFKDNNQILKSIDYINEIKLEDRIKMVNKQYEFCTEKFNNLNKIKNINNILKKNIENRSN